MVVGQDAHISNNLMRDNDHSIECQSAVGTTMYKTGRN